MTSSSTENISLQNDLLSFETILYITIAGVALLLVSLLLIIICCCCNLAHRRNRYKKDDVLEMQKFKKKFPKQTSVVSVISQNSQQPTSNAKNAASVHRSPLPSQDYPLEKKEDTHSSSSGDLPSNNETPIDDRFIEPDPIPLTEFCKCVKHLHENSNQLFTQEYSSLSTAVPLSCKTGRADYNMAKNRFKDIISYDHSRVVLKEEPGICGSDYINANYLHGYLKEKMYIAAQGPTSKTVADFWRMVWEQKLCTIVMLTRCIEGGKTKCHQYWPDQLKKTILHDNGISVTLQNVTSFAAYEYQKISVKYTLNLDTVPLEVTHFQYTVWPDHGVPQQSNSLMAFIRRVRVAHPPRSSAPLLVHCSAGVGRSGTFITLDSMMMRVKHKTTVDVCGFVKAAREQRAQMVQTEAQYIFIYDALDDFIKFGETTIESPQLPSAVHDKSILAKQFQMLEECSPLVNEQSCSEALLPHNIDKNRFRNIVPFNRNRVILWSSDRRQQYYINASLVDNYSHRSGYIATQTLLPTTGREFWQMVWEFHSLVIVTLAEEEEKLMLTEQGAEVEAGKMKIVLKKEQKNKGFMKRSYQLSGKIPSSHHNESLLKVTQYQLTNFPTLARGSSTTFLSMIDNVLKTQMSTGNNPITVMCQDGSGHSGVFMVVYSQLEKLKVEGLVDIFQCVRTMRTRRPGIVADLEQYELCHHILADYLASVETYANFC